MSRVNTERRFLPRFINRDWRRKRIKVESGRLRGEAIAVLELYKRKQGTVYNSRQGF
jgi:hypothetical protein